MASRKEQKEQARAARLAAEQEAASRAARTQRLRLMAGAVVIAAVVIVVAVVISTSGGGGLQTGAKATQTYKTVAAELQGIPQSGTTLGNPKAKYTLTYFGDLECPICAEFTTTSTLLPEFIQKQVKTGQAKVVYRSLCTATCNDEGSGVFQTQQTDAYAAGSQDLFWDYAELFYREQGVEGSGYATPSFFSGIAKQIPGLKLSTWEADTKDPDLLSQVESDESLAAKDGFTATPSLVMAGPKGETSMGSGIPEAGYSAFLQAEKAVS